MSAFTLQLWACWLFCNASSAHFLKHVSYSAVSACFLMLSFLDLIFFDLNFLAYFFITFLFDWFYSCIWDFDQIYYHKWLSHFVLCSSWKVFCLFYFSSCFVFLFEISVKFISISCYLIMCSISEKDFLFAFSNF